MEYLSVQCTVTALITHNTSLYFYTKSELLLVEHIIAEPEN